MRPYQDLTTTAEKLRWIAEDASLQIGFAGVTRNANYALTLIAQIAELLAEEREAAAGGEGG